MSKESFLLEIPSSAGSACSKPPCGRTKTVCQDTPATRAPLPTGHVTSNPALYDRRWDAFAFRVKQFTWSLSSERRIAVANRQRFYSMPYLRPTDATDLDDRLP